MHERFYATELTAIRLCHRVGRHSDDSMLEKSVIYSVDVLEFEPVYDSFWNTSQWALHTRLSC